MIILKLLTKCLKTTSQTPAKIIILIQESHLFTKKAKTKNKTENNSVGKDVEKLEPHTAGRNGKYKATV